MGLLSLNAMAQKLTEYVDPFIGTTNFSVCNPGAVLPHGLMSVVPFNVMGSDLNTYDKDARWWSAPYEYHNKYLTGFAHVTLSGVGCPELGTLLTMPTSGKLSVDYHDYGSEYDGEQARPGYYGVNLKKYGIRAEVTSTLRSSRERFTMPKGEGHLLLNIGDGLTNETGGMVRRVNNQEIEGMRLLGTFCYNPLAVFPIYFVMRVNKLPKEQGAWKQQPTRQGVKGEWDPDNGRLKLYKNYTRELAGDGIGYYYSFDCEEGEQVEVSMGVSFVSIENRRARLSSASLSKPTRNGSRRLGASPSRAARKHNAAYSTRPSTIHSSTRISCRTATATTLPWSKARRATPRTTATRCSHSGTPTATCISSRP